MKAGALDLAALAAPCETELAVEVERSAPASELRPAIGESGWSTLNALFCRAFPGLSRYWYDAIGEGLAEELDD
jgi:hypothetical protein